ncbi:MAG TPA: hypothetical protein VGE69_15695 [Pseudomonadales bacterium]
MKSNSYYRAVRYKRGRAFDDPDFPALFTGGVPEYKHDKSEIAILRKTPAAVRKAPRRTPFPRSMDHACASFLFVILEKDAFRLTACICIRKWMWTVPFGIVRMVRHDRHSLHANAAHGGFRLACVSGSKHA